MPQFLLDTNILIYAYKGLGRCREHMAAARPNDMAVSTITLFEIEYGIAKSRHPGPLSQFLSGVKKRCAVLGFDDAAATHAAQIRAQLAATGQPIGHYDLLIAGTALTFNLTLVTRNTREFERVAGLRVENWFE